MNSRIRLTSAKVEVEVDGGACKKKQRVRYYFVRGGWVGILYEIKAISAPAGLGFG